MVRNGRKLDEIRLSRPQSRAPKARNRRGGGGGWAETFPLQFPPPPPPASFAPTRHHPLVDFVPFRARLDTRQSYLIEFLVVWDHFFVRSSVGSLWLGLGFDPSSPIVRELTRLSFPLVRFRHNHDLPSHTPNPNMADHADGMGRVSPNRG